MHARSIVHTSTKTKSFSGRAFFYQKIFCICCSCVGVGWSNQLPFLREIHAVCLYCFAQKDTQHSTKHFFSDVYLFCLHKDPNDATKLRPLGIPTAMRRIIARHVAQHFKPLPYNFAVGIPQGSVTISTPSNSQLKNILLTMNNKDCHPHVQQSSSTYQTCSTQSPVSNFRPTHKLTSMEKALGTTELTEC